MSLFHRNQLPRGQRSEQNIVQSVRGRVGGFVEHVRAEQAVVIGELVVYAGGEEVLVNHLLAGESEWSNVSIPDKRPIGQMVEGKVGRRAGIYSDLGRGARIIGVPVRNRAQLSCPCRRGGHSRK